MPVNSPTQRRSSLDTSRSILAGGYFSSLFLGSWRDLDPRDSPREARFKQNHGEGPISLGGVSRCYNPPPQKMGGGHLSCWCKSNQSFFLVSMTKTRHYRYDTRINDKTHFTTTLIPCHSEVSEMQQQKPCCKSSCISGVLHDQTEKSSWIQYSNWFWTHLNTLGLYGFLFSHLIDPS